MSAKSRYRLHFCLIAPLWAAIGTGSTGCGYRSIYGGDARRSITVSAGQVMVPESGAAQAALSGAKSELASAGRLARGSGYPRLVVDVLRVDEASRGVHVESGQPAAGGMGVAVTVRGRLLFGPDQDPAIDTGDLRRAVQVTGDADPRTDSAAYDQALRSAGERAGHAAARVVLGIPEPSDEAP